MSDIQERLKKIRTLALESTNEGERSAAQVMLDKLMKKYNVDEKELVDDTVECRDFYFHGATENKLLHQIMYKVTNCGSYYTVSNRNTGRRVKTVIRCYCTKAQEIEINFLFDFYKQLFWKEHEFFVSAFIQKHNLYGTSRDHVTVIERSLEEELKIAQMARGLSDESPRLRIEDGGHSE